MAVGADHDVEVAWFTLILELLVVEHQIIGSNGKAHRLGLALFQVYTLEAFQLFHWA